MELFLIPPRKSKLNYRNRFVASLSGEIGLLDAQQHNSLPVGCTIEAHFENEVSVVLMRNSRRPTEFSVLRVDIKQQCVSPFLQAALIPARHRSYVFLSTEDVETVRCIGWCCAAFDFVWCFFSNFSSSFVVKKSLLPAQAVALTCFFLP